MGRVERSGALHDGGRCGGGGGDSEADGWIEKSMLDGLSRALCTLLRSSLARGKILHNDVVLPMLSIHHNERSSKSPCNGIKKFSWQEPGR